MCRLIGLGSNSKPHIGRDDVGCAELEATGAVPQPADSTAGTHDLKREEELDSIPTSPQRSLQSRVFRQPRLYANVMKAFMIVLETGGRQSPERMRLGKAKKILPVGKLPHEHLRSLLRHLPKHDSRLLIGPQIGEDAAVIDAGDRYLVVTTDPITFATEHIGRYAVHINANDVAVLGARPLWFFVVMLLPERRTTAELAETILADVRATCDELGLTLGGGHTEITQGLDRPILIGQMLGEVALNRLVRKSCIAIGDLILLTRGVAIEGTAILAREKSEQLRRRVDPDLLARATRFLNEPGISVVNAALSANVDEVVHAMHDPTEGGLAAGLFELVEPAGLGLRVIRERIPVYPETDAICNALRLDPLKLIASGALLVAAAPDRANSVQRAIEAKGIPVAVIGEVRPASEGITIATNGAVEPLTPPVRDEIARAFEDT